MILTTEKITAILRDKPHAKLISQAQTYSKKLMMHMTGIGLKGYLNKLDYFEKDEVKSVREQYCRSNKDLFARLHRPIDKVFSARGGSVYYNLPEQKEKQLRNALTDVEYGYSLRKWIENFWLNAYEYDPMGLVFIEIDETGKAYPTYKSIMDVQDYKMNGRKLDYLILKTDKRIEEYKKGDNYTPIFRVIDDAFDCLIAWDGSVVTKINDEVYPNYFGKVPALINSDLFDQLRGMYVSPDDAIVGIADEFLQEGSYFNIFKKYHFFPKAWQYQRKCRKCEGSGKRNGEDCSSCSGTGDAKDWKVNETVQVPVPQSKDQPIIAPDIAGYITPDIDGWEAMDKSLDKLEELMYRTMWGTTLERKDNETATGRFIDVQPVNDRLSKYSDAAETVEEFVVNAIGSIMFNAYGGADVNYGRRFLIETPDEVWLKYQDARTKGAPQATLDEILMEYYQTKYTNDSFEMQKYIKLMALEPFVHYTVQQVQTMNLSDEDYLKKVYFNEWVMQLQQNDLVVNPVQALSQKLTEYVSDKKVNIPAQKNLLLN